MNKRKNIFIILGIILLIVILAISSYFFFKQVFDDNKLNKEFEEIQDIVTTEIVDKTNDEGKKDVIEIVDLKNLYEINNDLVGWIKIDGTNIDYPVMQNEDYYLRRNIYKNYSYYGTPYLAKYCDVNNSDNLVIYGHHIKNNSMFGELENYKKEAFYNDHKFIKFYTLQDNVTIEHNYEIIAVFKTIVYSENEFKYYSFNNAKDSEDFNDYVSRVKQLELYETDKTANYGDKLITLSTCEYSRKNGRIVVVAKEV